MFSHKKQTITTTFSLVPEAKLEKKQERSVQGNGESLYNYMSKNQQDSARLIPSETGIYHEPQGNLVTGQFLYVVLSDLSIIHVPEHARINDRRYLHSSLANGKKVRAAGKIQLEEGKLILISNESGHYKPTACQMATILEWFVRQSNNPDLIFQDHTHAKEGFAYEYNALSFAKATNNHTTLTPTKNIPVNQMTTTVIDDDLYTTEGVKSRFAGRPKISNYITQTIINIKPSDNNNLLFHQAPILDNHENFSEEKDAPCCNCTIF